MNKKTRGLLFLWTAILLFASSNSVIEKLGQLGASHPINGRNPISFCNVLFAGNAVAAIFFIFVFRKKFHFYEFKNIKPQQWGVMTLVSFSVSILGPIFYFQAIMTTEVINVVLISTTEITWALILGFLFMGEKPSKYTLVGTLLAFTGAAITFFLYEPTALPMEMTMSKANLGTDKLGQLVASIPKIGLIFAGLGAFFSILGDMLTNKYSKNIPQHIFLTYNTCLGTLFFFIVASSLFGLGHFADLGSPFLWKWMIFYGSIVIAFGIFSFSSAAMSVSPNNIAIAYAFSPVAGIIFAYLIVGEIPSKAQILGGLVILIGIAIGLYDTVTKSKVPEKKTIGFQGI